MNTNKRLLLTIFSCIGVGATAVVAHFNTKRAMKRVKADTKPKDALKLTWMCYLPTIAVGAATVTAIIFNQNLTKKQIAAIVSSAGLTTRLLREYEQKTTEMIGKEKFDDIRRAVAKDHEDGVILAVVPNIISDGLIACSEDFEPGGDDLFYDEFSNTWFRSNKAAVRMAEYHANRNFILRGDCKLSEFYSFLGIPYEDKNFEHMGWGFEYMEGGMYWIEFENPMAVRDDGEEYTIISMPYGPEQFTEDEEWSMSVAV